jgi:hypothetical protein
LRGTVGVLLGSSLCVAGLSAKAPSSAAQAARVGKQAPAVQRLLVLVRETPPTGRPSFHRGADRSFTVSTGGSGDRDDSQVQVGGDNGVTLGAGNAIRQVHLREGERVRLELPALQSLQFHLAGRAGAASNAAPTGVAGGNASAPSASGLVYFEAVSAFTARFALHGSAVRVELVPLRSGSVAAPWIDASGVSGGSGPIVLQGRVGEWIALGDSALAASGKSLNATAESPRPAALWVRVFPETEASDADALELGPADRATVTGTSQRP